MPTRRFALLIALGLAAGCAPKAAVTGPTTKTVAPTASKAPSAAPVKLNREVLKPPAGNSTHVQGTLVVDAAYLVKAGVGQIVSNDGNSAVYPAASLIGNDGASIVASGAGNIISNDGNSIITNDGASLIGNDGGSIVSNDGASAKARRLLATSGVLDDEKAAGFAIRAIGLVDNRPVPLGVDGAGKPVFVVLTDANGNYDLHLPADLAASVRLIASPPGTTDPRATYSLLVGKAGATDQHLTEPASIYTAYVRHLLLSTLRPAVVESGDGGQALADALAGRVGVTKEFGPYIKDLYDSAHAAHVERLTSPQREFVLQRFVDTLIARTPLEKVGVGNFEGYEGDPNEPSQHAFEDMLGKVRDGAAKAMATDPDVFNHRHYLVSANARRKAAGKAPYQIRKPADLAYFLADEYFANGAFEHAKMSAEVLQDVGVAPKEVYRLLSANDALGYSMAAALLDQADEIREGQRVAILEQLGPHAPHVPDVEPASDAPVAVPTAVPEHFSVSALASTVGQAAWHLAIGPDGDLYYTVVGPGPATVRKVALGQPGQPSTIVSDAVKNPLGLAFDPTAAVPTLYVADPTAHTITRVLPGPPEVLQLPAGAQLGEMHQIACTNDHALIVAQAHPTALLRVSLEGDHAVTVLAGTPVGTGDFMLSIPSGLAVGPDNAVYVADAGKCAVLRYQDGVLRVVAGREGQGGADGYYDNARFNYPQGLAYASDGSLLVSDSVNSAVRRVRLVGGAGLVTTLAGDADFKATQGVAIDAKGTIYVSDANFQIRVLTPN